MRMQLKHATVAVLATGALLISGCSSGDGASGNGDLDVSGTETPTFEPRDVPEINAEDITEPVEDTGLGLTYELQGTTSGNTGGSIITVLVTNNNDVAFPPDALDEPTLRLNDGTEIDSLDAEAAGVAGEDRLDLPLGVGASTNLRFPFDVGTGGLSGATFELGNVRFTGQLNQ